jgi:hypothetical protein
MAVTVLAGVGDGFFGGAETLRGKADARHRGTSSPV